MKRELTWKSATEGILRGLPSLFTLDDIRPYHSVLEKLFPNNRHVEAKIRQTLQILRDRGVVEFLGSGRYRKRVVLPQFSCLLDMTPGEKYASRSQAARAVIEPWAAFNLYCLECPSDDVSALPNNSKVADLRCPSCNTAYQIKSSNGRFGDAIHGGEFNTYRAALDPGPFPNLLLVEWDPRFSCVFVVQAIKGAEIGEQHIVPRNPLSATARRAGWRGCTIHVGGLPRIDLVAPQLRSPQDCRDEWRGYRRTGSEALPPGT